MIFTFFFSTILVRSEKKTALFIKQKQFYCLFFVLYFLIKLSYSLLYAEACNEFAGPISAALRLRAKHLFLKKCRRSDEPLAFGNTVSNLTGSRFEPQAFRFRGERVTARPTGGEEDDLIRKVI